MYVHIIALFFHVQVLLLPLPCQLLLSTQQISLALPSSPPLPCTTYGVALKPGGWLVLRSYWIC